MKAKRPNNDDNASIRRELGRRLRHYREFKGWTQAEFARALHVETDRYRKWEAGVAEAPYYILRSLSELTDHSIDFWLTGRPDPRAAA